MLFRLLGYLEVQLRLFVASDMDQIEKKEKFRRHKKMLKRVDDSE